MSDPASPASPGNTDYRTLDYEGTGSCSSAGSNSEASMEVEDGEPAIKEQVPGGSSRDAAIQPKSTASSSPKGDDDWSDNLEGLREVFDNAGQNRTRGHPLEGPLTTAGDGQPKEGPPATTTHSKAPDGDGAAQSYKGPASQDSVENRAKAYVKKKKGEITEELKKSFGDKILSYEAVGAANRRRMSAPYLQSGEPVIDNQSYHEGDFLSTADGRVLSMYLDTNLQLKVNSSYSFCPWDKTCGTCPSAINHSVMGQRPGEDDSPGREVFILSDQSYPPIIPSSTTLKCMRIIRIEHGSLHELTSLFIDVLGDRKLAGGGIVMLFSATHLSNVGLTAYIEDFVTARRRLLTALGPNIYFTAAPPLLLGGTENTELIKNIFALVGWSNSTMAEEVRLDASNDTALGVILENGSGGGQAASTSRVRLPKSCTSLEPSLVWSVGSNSRLPNRTGPISEEQEKKIVVALIYELQLKLALDLDTAPILDRNPGLRKVVGTESFLVVGSSNARRLNEALTGCGIDTGYVFANNWRATRKSVEDLAGHIKVEMSNRSYSTVVFHLLDNNYYFAQSEDGGRQPARKGKDGRFHFDGDLVLADKDGQYAILKLCEPLWEAAKGKKMVIVGPMARLITGSCCQDQSHAANRGNSDFYTKMKDELAASCRNIKDFLFTSGHRNGRVMDPARSLLGLTAAEIWGNDPVHPRKEAYEIIAKSVIEVERTCGSGQAKRKRSREDEGSNSTNTGPTHRGSSRGTRPMGSGGRGGWGEAARGHIRGQGHSGGHTRGQGHSGGHTGGHTWNITGGRGYRTGRSWRGGQRGPGGHGRW